MRGDKELRQEQGDTARSSRAGGRGRTVPARGKVGLSCLCPRGDGERERERESEEVRLLESTSHPAGKANWRQKFDFYWVTLSSSALPTHHPKYTWQNITLLGAGGCPWAPPGHPCPKQLQEWAPSAGGNKDSAKCGELQVSATTCKSPTCGP